MGRDDDQLAAVMDLIARVYDAALDEQLWPTVAPKIASTFEATSTALFTSNRRHEEVNLLSMTENFSAAALRAYEEYYAQRDVWFERAENVNPSTLFTNIDLMPDEEFEKTEIYNDFCRPNGGFFYIAGSLFFLGTDAVAALGIHRPRALGPFEGESKAAIGLFLPHLHRALQIRHRLMQPGIAAGVGLEGLERGGTATLVVTRDGRILYASQEAERLLRAGTGIAAVAGRLATPHAAARTRLAALIAGAVDTATGNGASPGGVMAIERDDRLPLTLLVAPFRPARAGLGAALPAAIVFIRDPERPTAMALALQGLFGLTLAEAAIAGALAQGRDLTDIAAGQRITRNTIRAHLKSIFAKTGTSRQAQLVSLILSSVATLGPPI
jgi:DNA-binding CsgD family transcriptional regulator